MNRTDGQSRSQSRNTLLADADVGDPLLHPADRVMTPFIREHGTWEPEEGRLLRRTVSVGDACIDIGANIGYLTVSLANLVGRKGHVFAVEPSADNVSILTSNVERNGVSDRVTVLPFAAGACDSELTLILSRHNRGDHHLLSQAERSSALVPSTKFGGLQETVQGVALDDHIAYPARDQLGVVKCDVQGYDHVALDGLQPKIRTSDATILVEFWPERILAFGAKPTNVLDYYRSPRPRVSLFAYDGPCAEATRGYFLSNCRELNGGFINIVLSREQLP